MADVYLLFAVNFLILLLIWRKLMATGTTVTQLLASATALSTAANSLASTGTAIEALVASLQSGGLITQPQLDSVNDSLSSSLSSLQATKPLLLLSYRSPAPAGSGS